ncbi:MAG: DUF4856 domain-containing protein [Balneolaceae bacterium]|nr:DUF4856 domain-containing protein [Balneolaceae bacterium]
MRLSKFLSTTSFFTCLLVSFAFVSCDVLSSGDDNLQPPDTYEFTRDGASSVAYPGQTDRLNMLGEMDAYLGRGDDGQTLSEQVLLDMYTNAGGDGGGNFSFTSDRQLANKTFAPDRDEQLFENLFADAAAASQNGANGVTASDGTAGLLVRENSGNTILVDEKGREFGQLIEKGLMGAVFYNQIFNVYLTDARIGPDVENEDLAEGANYTPKEHHFDEAFGYWGVPVDFQSDWPEDREDEPRFWGHYSDVVDNVRDGMLGTNSTIMDAFIRGRTAIVNKDEAALDEQVDILYEQLELVAAATAVHYINDTLGHLSAGNTGEAFHTLSEAWAFVNALKYSPRRAITVDQIETIQNSRFGQNGNFWKVTADGLNQAKSTLLNVYPDLEPVQDEL